MVGLVDDPRFELHEQGAGHPESPARVRAIRQALRSSGLKLVPIPAREATRAELGLVHAPEYVHFVEECCLDKEPAVLGRDVVVCRGSWKSALLAAGSAIRATQEVLSGRLNSAFCNLRPPGHHALADEAMGFCIFNNVALAAKWALEHGGLKKVAIVDWDVHHGNGTEAAVQGDQRLLYASLHMYGPPRLYPGTGARSHGNALNLPLPPSTGPAEHLRLFHGEVMPALRGFKPELILISCGFDAHKDDPLGALSLETEHYGEMTRALLEPSLCGRIVSVLEGGYNLEAIAAGAVAHVEALVDAHG